MANAQRYEDGEAYAQKMLGYIQTGRGCIQPTLFGEPPKASVYAADENSLPENAGWWAGFENELEENGADYEDRDGSIWVVKSMAC